MKILFSKERILHAPSSISWNFIAIQSDWWFLFQLKSQRGCFPRRNKLSLMNFLQSLRLVFFSAPDTYTTSIARRLHIESPAQCNSSEIWFIAHHGFQSFKDEKKSTQDTFSSLESFYCFLLGNIFDLKGQSHLYFIMVFLKTSVKLQLSLKSFFCLSWDLREVKPVCFHQILSKFPRGKS